MSKTVRRIVARITTLRSRVQQISEHGQVIRRTITTVITDTWTLVWAEEESTEWGAQWAPRNAEASDQLVELVLGKEENVRENVEDQSVLDNRPGGVPEPPVDAAPEID
jgi:hypothetical protein